MRVRSRKKSVHEQPVRHVELRRLAMGFTVDANVGRFVEPSAALDLNGFEGGDFQAGQEILLYVPHTVFNPPFFISLPDITGDWVEPMVSGKIQIPRVE